MDYRRTLMLIAAAALFAGCEQNNSPPPPRSSAPIGVRPEPSKPADNTAQNKADRNSDTITPMDQSQSKEDIRITAEIRRALLDDKSFSTNAQNCKIITDKAGVVTLRGVVETQAEKDAIEAKAKSVAGVTRVDNLLDVKNP